MRRASAATMRAKSDRIRTASSGKSCSRGGGSNSAMSGWLDFNGLIDLIDFFTGEHERGAQCQQPDNRSFTRVRAECEAQRAGNARGAHGMLADSAVRPKPGDLFFDAIVDLLQRVAQVFLGVVDFILRVVDFIFYFWVVCHCDPSSSARESIGLPALPRAP